MAAATVPQVPRKVLASQDAGFSFCAFNATNYLGRNKPHMPVVMRSRATEETGDNGRGAAKPIGEPIPQPADPAGPDKADGHRGQEQPSPAQMPGDGAKPDQGRAMRNEAAFPVLQMGGGLQNDGGVTPGDLGGLGSNSMYPPSMGTVEILDPLQRSAALQQIEFLEQQLQSLEQINEANPQVAYPQTSVSWESGICGSSTV